MKTSLEAARRENPDLNLTFMRMPGSGFDPQARIGRYFFTNTQINMIG